MKVIVVASPREGVGVTTAAINVSALLARQGESCCLVDAHPNRDAHFLAGVEGRDRGQWQHLQGERLRGYLHGASVGAGILSLSEPTALPLLETAYSRVVVDAGPHADIWLPHADAVFLMALPDPLSIRAARAWYSQRVPAIVPSDRCFCVINRFSPSGALGREAFTIGDSPQMHQFWPDAPETLAAAILKGRIVPETDTTLLPSWQATGEVLKSLSPRVWENSACDVSTVLAQFQDSFSPSSMDPVVVREEAVETLRQLLLRFPPQSASTQAALIDQVLSQALGLGPLEALLQDEAVTEVMVNGTQSIYVERGGVLSRTDSSIPRDAQLHHIIERILAPLGRRVDESSPMVDARLADGSRVNVILPPLALDGPTITIRKFSPRRWQLADLIQMESLDIKMAELLQQAMAMRRNIIVSGGTGSGKTTLLNVLSSLIPEDERIVTIEDAAELRLHQPHVVRLESRPPNLEGRGAVGIRDLVKNALRMRPNRIVVGECRGAEALDMLQAMNTGHDGSLTTVHANSPRAALSRLETLVMFAGLDLPVRAIREQIASAIHLIVQVSRLPGGARKIVQISELGGLQGDVITLQDLWVYRDGQFIGSGFRPRFMEAV